jgi:hypothetical protein
MYYWQQREFSLISCKATTMMMDQNADEVENCFENFIYTREKLCDVKKQRIAEKLDIERDHNFEIVCYDVLCNKLN